MNPQNLSPLEKPILQSLEQLPDRQTLRERVQQMTAGELQTLVEEMNGVKEMPKIFQSPEMQSALDQRLAETGVKLESNSKLQEFKTQFETAKGAALDTAEKSFLKEMMEKGGVWTVIGGAAITLLSWLGFKKAKALRESFKTKGYLRTAVEGAKEHPYFAAFIAALGIPASFAAFKYLQNNAEPITEAIGNKAKEMGIPQAEATKQLAHKAREVLGNGMDQGLKKTIIVITGVLGGSYDEETGVVTLGHSLMHSPAIVAYEAGFRRRAGEGLMKSKYSRFLIEDRFSAIMRGTGEAIDATSEAMIPKRQLAARGLELLTNPVLSADGEAEVGRIVAALGPDMGLDGKAIERVKVSPQEAGKHLDALETKMKQQHVEEIKGFNGLKNQIENKLFEAESNIRKKEFPGTLNQYKEGVVNEINNLTKAFNDDVAAKKLSIGKNMEDTLNGLRDTIGEHARYQLDSTPHGGSLLGRSMEKVTTIAENTGTVIRKVPGGKFALAGMKCYAFLPLLPLAGQGMAALRQGEAGEAAKKALIIDATEVGVGFIPVVGELNDFRAAFTGKDLNGRELDTWSRVTAGAMGTLGTAALIGGFFTGGATYGGFKLLRLAGGAVRGVKAATRATNGIAAVRATGKALDAVDSANDATKALKKMYTATSTQKMARGVVSAAHNAQRAMQIVAYTHLGYSLASGAMEIYNTTDNIMQKVSDKVTGGIDTAEQFANKLIPGQ